MRRPAAGAGAHVPLVPVRYAAHVQCVPPVVYDSCPWNAAVIQGCTASVEGVRLITSLMCSVCRGEGGCAAGGRASYAWLWSGVAHLTCAHALGAGGAAAKARGRPSAPSPALAIMAV